MLVLAGVTLGYLVLQRYTGVDWVGGLSKCIPESRFAYGVYRPNGWMGHPLSLGFNLMLVTVVAWMRGFHATSRHDPEKRFWRILFTVAAISLLLNQSRWPIAVALGLIAVTSLGKLKKSPKTVILIFCLGVAGVFGDPALRGRLSEVVTNPQQLLGKGERAGFWNVHAKMFRDHLLLGVGYHRRKSASLDYYNRAGYTNNEKKYAAHNIYLQILADSGLVGFLGFLSLMAGLALTAWRQLQGGKPALLTLLAAAMLGGLMQNNFRDSEFLYCFWMLVAVCLAQARIPEKEIAP